MRGDDDDIYWTEDESVCNRSRNYINNNCNCSQYNEVDWVGPYCSDWIEGDSPFCFLSNRNVGKFCPGAVQGAIDDLYWTEDDMVCNRSRA